MYYSAKCVIYSHLAVHLFFSAFFGSCHYLNTHKHALNKKKKSCFVKVLICILQNTCVIFLFQRAISQKKSACLLFNNRPNKRDRNMPTQRGKLTYSETQISVGTTIFQPNVPGHMPHHSGINLRMPIIRKEIAKLSFPE